MLSIVRRGEHRYGIFENDRDIGSVSVSRSPLHDRHCQLHLELERYDPEIAGELFRLLRRELGMPLKVMACTTRSLHAFLTAGGFARKRRCWELEVSAKDLISPLCAALPLTAARRGSRLYDACCALLYDHYCTTHAAVSPLTATLDEFRTHLPDTILCTPDDHPRHCAFLEEDELAYTATADPNTFPAFAQSLLHELFRRYETITTECDDCDECAMTVKALFRTKDDGSWDTYLYAP